MVEQDTVKLLRECDAGVKMGGASIDDVLSYVNAFPLSEPVQGGKRALTRYCQAANPS